MNQAKLIRDAERRAAKIKRLGAELEAERGELKELVDKHGSKLPRSDKSLWISTPKFKIVLSRSSRTYVDDQAVRRIRQETSSELFVHLFDVVETFRVTKHARSFLQAKALPKGAPRGLRKMFSDAVRTEDLAPRLSIEERGKTK